ncbi:MAG TPA: linear amide C-N hydrolase, partial [Chlamydiales bacterium]|nr:linear amide C-N hydrolase [Chlamydiales bacterium]
MRQKIVPQLCAALITSFAIMQDAHACTDFVLTATDKSIINGRSMEFALPFESQLIVHKRGLKHQSQTPNEKKGISWTAKYGFVAVNGLNLDFVIDGINEKGLGFGALWL